MTYNSDINIQTNKEGSNVLLWVCRLLVGFLFIFSGLIKANDPIGFGYKLQEYFLVFQSGFLNDYSPYIAIVVCALEIILGVLLILGIGGRTVAWGLLLVILFFTFLTFYSAFFEVVTSCGCFGDAIPLTPWQSFIKDLVLLALVIVIFVYREKINPLISSVFTNNLFVFLTIVVSFGIGIYTMFFLPFIDFLPYKVGNNIPSLMKLPDHALATNVGVIYSLKNNKTGETKSMTSDEYMSGKIWEDTDWEVLSNPENTVLNSQLKAPIPDLVILDDAANIVTDELLNNPYYNFVVVSVDVTKLTPIDLLALDKLNETIREVSSDNKIRAVLLTSSSMDDVKHLSDQLDLVLEIFYVDPVPLKSMVRSNPGVLLLQNGNVINKWSKFSFPNAEALTNLYFNK